jgi:tRNA pseudouridine-54 N-methylase
MDGNCIVSSFSLRESTKLGLVLHGRKREQSTVKFKFKAVPVLEKYDEISSATSA